MDLDDPPLNIEALFPQNLDGTPQFWTISDDDFEPDPTLSQYPPLPDEDQPVYHEGDEVEARSEEPTFSEEEEEYLNSLDNLGYGMSFIYYIYFVLDLNLSSK